VIGLWPWGGDMSGCWIIDGGGGDWLWSRAGGGGGGVREV